MKKHLTANQINEIRQLSAEGVSLEDISRNLNLSKSTIYYHAKGYCRKMTTFDVAFLNDSEKGYVVGLFLGDGSFNMGHSEPRFFVRFAFDAKRDLDVVSRLTQIFGKAGKKQAFFLGKATLLLKCAQKSC